MDLLNPRSPDDIETAAAMARVRLTRVATDIVDRSRPSAIAASVSENIKARATEAMPVISREAGKIVGKNLLVGVGGVIGAFSVFELGRKSVSAPSTPGGGEAPRSPVRGYEDPSRSDTTPRAPSSPFTMGKAVQLIKTAATSSAALMIGHMVSKTVAPSRFEQTVLDRYSGPFKDWVQTFIASKNSPLKTSAVNAFGLPGIVAMAISALSLIATLTQPDTATGTRSGD
jgi:hypothetical protein